jgi:hypothetical protein
MASPDQELVSMRVVAGGLIAASVVFLGLATVMHTVMGMRGSLDILTWIACGYALVSPVLGNLMAAQAARNAQSGVSPRRAALMVSYGVMEMSVMFCGVALMAGPHLWPLAAALVPLGAMIAQFPRGGVPRTG